MRQPQHCSARSSRPWRAMRAAQIDRVVVESPAGRAIIESAHDAELIVVGRRGISAMRVARPRFREQLRRGARALPRARRSRPAPRAPTRALRQLAQVPRHPDGGTNDARQVRAYTDSMDIELLASTLKDHGEPAYRARQVWEWAARGATRLRRDDERAGPAPRGACARTSRSRRSPSTRSSRPRTAPSRRCSERATAIRSRRS